jgi:tetratricopeptide (TPR) repeat protein
MTFESTSVTAREGVAALGKPPLIGRIEERETIFSAASRAIAESRPQVVTIIGSSGVGKTRLVNEALADLRERIPDLRAFVGACRAGSGVQAALAKILRTRLGLAEGSDAATQSAEMRARVTELFGDRRVQEILHFLGAFLGLRFPGTPLADAVEENSRAFEQVSRAVLRRFFEVDAHASPLMLVIEDLHHATPDGVRLVRELVENVTAAPLVIVVTARPEFLARVRDWPEALGERHSRVELGPLSVAESEVLAHALLAAVPDVPRDLVDAAVEMGGGNPLLIEQLVRIFFERGVIEPTPDGGYAVALERLDSIELPLNVEDAVRARLSALSPVERELLEMGAVMGPVFWLGGLVVLGRARKEVPNLWGGSEDLAPHFRDVLDGLAFRDYVLRMPDSAIAGDEEWIFKHNMEREMLAALVAPEYAADYHLILAEWLEFRIGERGEEQLDLLAHHYEAGSRPLRAARCFLESADRARGRYANLKAVEHYRKGLALLGEHDISLRLEAHHHLGGVLQLLGRSDDALAEFRKMLALAYRMDLKAKGGAAHNRVGRLYRETGQLDHAMRHLGTSLALFEAAGDERGIASSLDDIGKVHWMRGDFDTALRYLQDALTRREALGDKRSIALSLNNIGLVFQDSGQYKPALEALTRALELRREVDDLAGVTATLNNLGTIHQDKGEDARAIEIWFEGLEVAREVGDRKRQAILLLNIGEGQYRLKNPDEATKLLKEVEKIATELGDRIVLAEAWRGLGKAALLRGEVGVALPYLERAVEQFVQTRSRVHVGIATRTLGECLATWGYESEHGRRAEKAFRDSMEIFEDAGAELELARTARVFSEYLRTAPEHAGAGLMDEADRLRTRADEIFGKLRVSGETANEPPPIYVDDDGRPSYPGEATDPGINRQDIMEFFGNGPAVVPEPEADEDAQPATREYPPGFSPPGPVPPDTTGTSR